MKPLSFLLAVILCIMIAVPAPAEIIAEETIEFPTFSCTVNPGSYLIRGEENAGYLFICYPEYRNGNTTLTINASQDTLINFNPATMDNAFRELFGMTLLTETTEQLKNYGFTVSDATYAWGDLLEVDGQTGIMLKNSVQLSANGVTTRSYSCACLICAGEYRYNFSVGSQVEEEAETLLRSFLDTLRWKGLSSGKTPAKQTAEEAGQAAKYVEMLGEAKYVPIVTAQKSPAEILQEDGEGVLAALFFLELEKNTGLRDPIGFLFESYSDKKIYAGINQADQPFAAFPNMLSDNSLVVALAGKSIIKIGMFTDSELEAFLKEAKASKEMVYSYFIGSYKGVCSALKLDPSPYN